MRILLALVCRKLKFLLSAETSSRLLGLSSVTLHTFVSAPLRVATCGVASVPMIITTGEISGIVTDIVTGTATSLSYDNHIAPVQAPPT
jgi:hypothetical protein